MNPYQNQPPRFPNASPFLHAILNQNGNQQQHQQHLHQQQQQQHQQQQQQHQQQQQQHQQQQQQHQQQQQQHRQQQQQLSPGHQQQRQAQHQFMYHNPPYQNSSSMMMNNSSQNFSDLNNNNRNNNNSMNKRLQVQQQHQNFGAISPTAQQHPNNPNFAAPNRYITNSEGMFANPFFQNYNVQQQQASKYNQNPAPPYPGQRFDLQSNNSKMGNQQGNNMLNRPIMSFNTQLSVSQQTNVGANQQTNTDANQQGRTVYSPALMRRLSGQISSDVTTDQNQQGKPTTRLMQQLQRPGNTTYSSLERGSSRDNTNLLKTSSENTNRDNSSLNANEMAKNTATTTPTNQTNPNDKLFGGGPPLFESSEKVKKLTQSLLYEERLMNPLTDIADDLMNSPMSVGSNKSESSNHSLTDIRKLSALSLSLNSSNNSEHSSAAIADDKDLSPSFTQMLQKVKVGGHSLDVEEENSKTSFIDAVLTGMLSGLSRGLDKHSDDNTGGVDIDLLDANTIFNIMDEEQKERSNSMEESVFFQRSLSSPTTPSNAADKKNQQQLSRNNNNKPNSRNNRLKSDSSLLKTAPMRNISHPYVRYESVPSDIEPYEEPSAFKRRHTIDSKPLGVKRDPSAMYFQNKDYFKFRSRFREVTRRHVQAGNLTAGQIKMKSSRLFLELLTKKHEWVADSVVAAVKNEKEINLKNFTKRKITVHNDIPPEQIHQYTEVSVAPFTYSNLEANGKTKPSNTLMQYLLENKNKATIKTEKPSTPPPKNIL